MVKTEVREPIIEKKVEAPIVRREGLVEAPKVITESSRTGANLGTTNITTTTSTTESSEEKASLGGMITGVYQEVKHAIFGDEKKD